MRTRSALIFVVVLASLAVTRGTSSAAPGGCPHYGRVRVAGKVHISGINEISGADASARTKVLWAEEDSGNPARVYAVSPTGHTRANILVTHATNHDWEDIAYAYGQVWVGDIGSRRNQLQLYWFPEPRLTAHRVRARAADLRYQGGAMHNAEAMFLTAGKVFVVTKERSSWQGLVYQAGIHGLHDGASRILRRIGKVTIGAVTGADAGPRGFAVRNLSGTGQFYRWRQGHNVVAALKGQPCSFTAGRGESLAFSPWSPRLYTIPEGRNPQVRFVAKR